MWDVRKNIFLKKNKISIILMIMKILKEKLLKMRY